MTTTLVLIWTKVQLKSSPRLKLDTKDYCAESQIGEEEKKKPHRIYLLRTYLFDELYNESGIQLYQGTFFYGAFHGQGYNFAFTKK